MTESSGSRLRRRCLGLGLGALVLSLIADAVLISGDHHATPIWGSGLAGYWPVFAVFWFLVFVYVSKWIGRLGVQQDEGYYPTDGQRGDDDA
jgi:hypothetical protein